MIISKFQVNNIFYESYKKTLIIAEIGSNHDNQLNKCKKMILEAKKAGCDAVKFQLLRLTCWCPRNIIIKVIKF